MSQWVCAVCGADSDLVSWPAPCGKCGSRAVIKNEDHEPHTPKPEEEK